MKLSDFDYTLPEGLIAQYPLKKRDESRMMVLEREAHKIYEKKFTDIIDYLNKGDTIVLNDARVVPARILGRKDTGAKIELFLLENLGDNTYKVLAKPSKRLKEGARVSFSGGITATVLENADIGKIIRFDSTDNIDDKLRLIGQVPLPPYIKRQPEKLDEERYQTVYAKSDGATASPTAGLHFTDDIIKRIKDKGVNIAHVTLNVSYGTFAPVLEEEIENHKMHKEYFKMPRETIEIINKTKEDGNKILAVGTTATRVLEATYPLTPALSPKGRGRSSEHYSPKGRGRSRAVCFSAIPSPPKGERVRVRGQEGYTDLFIYPGYKFKVVDTLLTNFHIPKSTLLMLVSAFAGREFILEAYKKAIETRFRFFSYGDCMLIV